MYLKSDTIFLLSFALCVAWFVQWFEGSWLAVESFQPTNQGEGVKGHKNSAENRCLFVLQLC